MMIKAHPTYDTLDIEDELLETIKKSITVSLLPIQFTWSCGYTKFDTVITPAAYKIRNPEFDTYDIKILPANRFLLSLIEFKSCWHFDINIPSEASYIEEKMKLGDYDSKSVSLFLKMLNETEI